MSDIDASVTFPGATCKELACSLPVVPFSKMSGRYAVVDYIQARSAQRPQTHELVEALVTPPEGFPYSITVWLFEHVRQICRDVGFLIAEFIGNDICTPTTCPRMRATDKYMFKCAAHQGN